MYSQLPKGCEESRRRNYACHASFCWAMTSRSVANMGKFMPIMPIMPVSPNASTHLPLYSQTSPGDQWPWAMAHGHLCTCACTCSTLKLPPLDPPPPPVSSVPDYPSLITPAELGLLLLGRWVRCPPTGKTCVSGHQPTFSGPQG